jgi:fructose-1,6-bisphosphatase I
MADTLFNQSKIITIERHILDEQQIHPEATGILTNILYDLALAGKYIASQTTRAGLSEILGATENINIQGETVMKLDQLADQTIFRLNDHTGRIAVMASEEHEHLLPIPDGLPVGKYVLLFDPLDGSSNIDYNATIGTIFAIYRRLSLNGPGTLDDCLQPGSALVAAGYMIYGSSTMLVYSSGSGVHGFTLDPMIGEFLLTHPDIQIPKYPKYYSVNQGNEIYWSKGVVEFTHWLQGIDGGQTPLSQRYIGTLVGDFHRTLLSGGVYYYPADTRYQSKPGGKLRLTYEAAPFAFLAHHAGGYASDGRQDILNIRPTSLHQRTPLFIGDWSLVKKAEEFIAVHDS